MFVGKCRRGFGRDREVIGGAEGRIVTVYCTEERT